MKKKKDVRRAGALPIPPSVAKEKVAAREITRIWLSKNGDLHAIIDSSTLEDVSMWGVVLSQLGEHVAAAYKDQDALKKIKKKLDEVWDD